MKPFCVDDLYLHHAVSARDEVAAVVRSVDSENDRDGSTVRICRLGGARPWRLTRGDGLMAHIDRVPGAVRQDQAAHPSEPQQAANDYRHDAQNLHEVAESGSGP